MRQVESGFDAQGRAVCGSSSRLAPSCCWGPRCACFAWAPTACGTTRRSAPTSRAAPSPSSCATPPVISTRPATTSCCARWLLLTGYPTGHADPAGNGLEFASGFFSLFFGVLLIALVYALARRLAGRTVALVAAVLVSLSPFNVWYSQEVRMYTLGAVLAVAALWALVDIAGDRKPALRSYVIYALAAASGMYILYYFAFLLIPLNLWALVRAHPTAALRGSAARSPNLAAAILYAPWLGIAFRQATQPPVPPWRTAPDLAAALLESWTALSFGQSAPAWLWPALLLTLALFILGLLTLGMGSEWDA